jgi:hypothetical protein
MIPTSVFYLVGLGILFLVFVVFATAREKAFRIETFNIDVEIEALLRVEGWDGHSRGASGERGYWQITPDVWKQFSQGLSFAWAGRSDPMAKAYQRSVALAYVNWIKDNLERAKRDVNPYMVSLVYGAGWHSVINGKPHRPTAFKKDYAQRATNLYFDLLKHEKNKFQE